MLRPAPPYTDPGRKRSWTSASAARRGRGARATHERIVTAGAQLDEARQAYCKVLNAYVTICRRINEERQEIMQALTGLSGAT